MLNNNYPEAESFEQAVYTFFQAIHPYQELEKSRIPYAEVSKFITKLLDCHPAASASQSPSPLPEANACHENDQQEEQPKPRILQLYNIEQHHHFVFDLPISSTSQLPAADALPPDVKVDKRTLQYKAAHKLLPRQGNTGNCVAFDCQESSLLIHFEQFFKETLISLDSSLDCFYLALNSLAMFFFHNTWSTKCQENVLKFLRKFVLRNSGELCRENGIPADRKKVEIEVMCLLELFIASFSPCPTSTLCEMNIMQKLRLLRYVYGAEQVDKFVNSTLYPQFSHSLPQIMSAICQKLQIPTAKCRKVEVKEGKISIASIKQETTARNTKKVGSTPRFRCPKVEPVVGEESSAPEEATKCTKSGARAAYFSTSDGETPVREAQELELPDERKSGRQRQPTKKTSKRNVGLKKRMLARRVVRQVTTSNIVRSNIVKSKLRKRKLVPAVTSPPLCSEIEHKVQQRVKIKSEASSSGQPIGTLASKNAVVALDDKLLARYKARMDTIKSNARHNKLNSQEHPVLIKRRFLISQVSNTKRCQEVCQEVFYGRSVGRQGLFDFEAEEEESQSSCSSYTPKPGSSRQKNRSGRAVKRREECVYIAHTLLNIHNPRPLQPFKANALLKSSNSTFKIRKFVKRASRSERKRMEKFKKSQLAISNTPQVL